MNKKRKGVFITLLTGIIFILVIGMVSCSIHMKGRNKQQITPETLSAEGKWSIFTWSDASRNSKDTDFTDSSDPNGSNKRKKEPGPSASALSNEPTDTADLEKTTVPENPSEPVRQDDPKMPVIRPDLPRIISFGSTSYSAATVEIITPSYSHADTEFTITTVCRHVKSLEWIIAEVGNDTPSSDFLKGTPGQSGGKITITKPGKYTITAIAKNYGNRTYAFTKTITIHPSYGIKIMAETIAHTDHAFEVKTILSDNIRQQLNWHIYKDGNEVRWTDYISGTLTNEGGTIQIKEKGRYTLKACMYDETNREFWGTAGITVLPVVEISITAPKSAHTDTAALISTETKELDNLSIHWSIAKDGKRSALTDYIKGEITNQGGSVYFKEKGTYHLTAAVTDQSGRVFSDTAEVKIYPLATFSFDLPSVTHTDIPVSISVDSSELQDMVAEWTVVYNGKIVPAASVLEGSLNNGGGNIRFREKGVYVLKAALSDAIGREYSHESTVTVYPVAETGFYLPPITHTDVLVDVKTSFRETDDLTATWSLTKDGRSIALTNGFDGTLSNDGGKIQFTGAGSYELTATVTDSIGRSFAYSSPVMVYPVITLNMELPEETHTDKPVNVTLSGENLGTLPVEWEMLKNKVSTDIIKGLNNQGGSLSIPEKGLYTVLASVTDEAGRTFSTEAAITVHPVPSMKIILPHAAHTDNFLTLDFETKDMEGLTAAWYVDNTHGFQDWSTYIDGTLQNTGGKIRFKRAGIYDLEARTTDSTGRVFYFDSNKIEILPVLQLSFDLPSSAHTDTQIDVRTRGNNSELPIEWTILKNGQGIPFNQAVSGSLNMYGGKICFTSAGEYRLNATIFDALGRIFSASQKITVYPLYNCSFTMPGSIHAGKSFSVSLNNSINPSEKLITWAAAKDGKPTLISDFKGSLTNTGGTVHIDAVGSYSLSATITDELGRIFTHEQSITVTNSPPVKPALTANVTRTNSNGRFLVNLSVSSTDPDGDAVTYEYEGKSSDNYYALGSYTVRARAKDNFGGVSEWAQVTFTVANSAPSRPVITRSPNTNSVVPGTPVTITASSTDPDGDPITYVWDGRGAQTATYPLGKNTVRVKAVDSAGAESPWAAIVFFVMDSSGSGGMMLTGPDSTIMENGIEGATITSYTFTVPPVAGHSGQDFGRVRGYNIITKTWDQLDYGTTTNGISFSRALTPGVYSKLEMYYYTNHDCMYGKSNITYTVNYYFE